MNKATLQKEAWIYKHRGEPYWYEYHIESQGFFTEVYAANASQARIKGWNAFVATRAGRKYR